MPDAREKRESFGALAVLIALCAVAYYPVLSNGFVNFDDILFIRDNPDFNPVKFDALIRYWRGPYFGGAFPLTYMFLGGVASFAWNGRGLEPFAFRLAGLLLHAGCVIVVFDILRMLLRSTRGALMGAAVFAVHPLQVEAVAWAVSPYTLLSLGAIDLYLRYAQLAKDPSPETQRARWALYAAAIVLFVMAMLAKPVAMMCVVIAAALDLGWLRRPWDKVTLALAPWGALALPVVVMTRTLIGTPPVVGPPLWVRPLVAMDALAFYLGKLVWPVGLVPDYGRSPQWLREKGPLLISWLVPVIVAIVLLAVVRRGNRLRSIALMAAFALSFFPVLGLLPFHFQVYSTVADRYAYLGMLVVAIAIGWWVAAGPWAAYVVGVCVVVLIPLTNRQSRYWHDTQALFEHNLALYPDSFAAHRILGYDARRRGNDVLASVHYANALHVHPDDPAANFNLGRILVDRGDYGAAIAHFKRALAAKPDDPLMRNNYGAALARAGRFDDAARQFEAILARFPRNADAAANLALVRAKMKAASRPTSAPATSGAP